MDDPVNENDHSGNGVRWRLRQSVDRGVEVLDSLIVVELSDARGSTMASVSMPSETINELLRPYLSIFVELQLDGTVSLDSEICAPTLEPSTETDILQLVSQAVAPEMLEDEPEAAQMLSKFRDRLLKSLEHVEQAIASLPKD
jgi:class 3 adenylate cyclase